jgi:hypothetical protein
MEYGQLGQLHLSAETVSDIDSISLLQIVDKVVPVEKKKRWTGESVL